MREANRWSVIGGDFGKKRRVERWIEIKGSRENELRDAELLVVVAECQRSQRVECRVIGVESLVESSEIVSKWRFG